MPTETRKTRRRFRPGDFPLSKRQGPVRERARVRFDGLEEVDNSAEGRAGNSQLLLGVLGHEIRSPLASIKSNVEVVLGGDAGPLNKDQKHFLGRVRRGIDRLEDLVDDLLDQARRPDRSWQVQWQPVDLGSLVKTVAEQHAVAIARARLHWDDAGVPPSLVVRTDPVKLTSILDNLVGNAVKYCRPGDTVSVRLHARAGGQTYRCEVVDTGPGMAPETLARIFEPFYRGPAAREAQVLGAGLGLHITRQLVRALGGRIRVDSTPGAGTRVEVQLPRNGQADCHGGRTLPEPGQKRR